MDKSLLPEPIATPEALPLEERYNRGARLADDCFCQGCGARGFTSDCPKCAPNARDAGR